MMEIKQLASSHSPYYPFVEQLLTLSFPAEEYRPLAEWKRFTDEKQAFHNQVILDDGQPVGLVTHWDFDRFCYVEHLAISPDARNGGYGGHLLQLLQHQLKRPIVLEVEEPQEEMARRRIGFYQRHGFKLWTTPYAFIHRDRDFSDHIGGNAELPKFFLDKHGRFARGREVLAVNVEVESHVRHITFSPIRKNKADRSPRKRAVSSQEARSRCRTRVRSFPRKASCCERTRRRPCPSFRRF